MNSQQVISRASPMKVERELIEVDANLNASVFAERLRYLQCTHQTTTNKNQRRERWSQTI